MLRLRFTSLVVSPLTVIELAPMPPTGVPTLRQGSDLFRQPAKGLTVRRCSTSRSRPARHGQARHRAEPSGARRPSTAREDLLDHVAHLVLGTGGKVREHPKAERVPERAQHLDEASLVSGKPDLFHRSKVDDGCPARLSQRRERRLLLQGGEARQKVERVVRDLPPRRGRREEGPISSAKEASRPPSSS